MSEFKRPYLLNPVRYFVQFFRIFKTCYVLSNDIRMNVVDIDIEDLFTVEYYKPFNISSVALFLRQTYVKQQIIKVHET